MTNGLLRGTQEWIFFKRIHIFAQYPNYVKQEAMESFAFPGNLIDEHFEATDGVGFRKN